MENFNFQPLIEILVVASLLTLAFGIVYVFWLSKQRANAVGANLTNFLANMSGNRLHERDMLIAWYKAYQNRESVSESVEFPIGGDLIKELSKLYKVRKMGGMSENGNASYEFFEIKKNNSSVYVLVRHAGEMEEFHIYESAKNYVWVNLVYGTRISEEQLGKELFELLEEKFQVKYKKSKRVKQEAYYYTLSPGMGGLNEVRHKTTNLASFMKGLEASILENCQIKWQNKEIDGTLKAFTAALIKSFGNYKFSGLLFGDPGTGKTSYMKALAGFVSKYRPQDRVFIIDPGVLASEGMRSAMHNKIVQWHNDYERALSMGMQPEKVLILVDEADNLVRATKGREKTPENQFLLDIMDGFTASVGVSIFLSVNLNREEIHPAFLRENRSPVQVEFYNMNKQTKELAKEFILSQLETGFSFDDEAYNSLPDDCTLAQVFACVTPQEVLEFLQGFEVLLSNNVSSIAEELEVWEQEEENEEEDLVNLANEVSQDLSSPSEIVVPETGYQPNKESVAPASILVPKVNNTPRKKNRGKKRK